MPRPLHEYLTHLMVKRMTPPSCLAKPSPVTLPKVTLKSRAACSIHRTLCPNCTVENKLESPGEGFLPLPSEQGSGSWLSPSYTKGREMESNVVRHRHTRRLIRLKLQGLYLHPPLSSLIVYKDSILYLMSYCYFLFFIKQTLKLCKRWAPQNLDLSPNVTQIEERNKTRKPRDGCSLNKTKN